MLPQRVRLQYEASLLHPNSVSSPSSICLLTSFPLCCTLPSPLLPFFSPHFSPSPSLSRSLSLSLTIWPVPPWKSKILLLFVCEWACVCVCFHAVGIQNSVSIRCWCFLWPARSEVKGSVCEGSEGDSMETAALLPYTNNLPLSVMTVMFYGSG